MMASGRGEQGDRKPQVGEEGGEKLEHAFEGAPCLPGKWTYALSDPDPKVSFPLLLAATQNRR